MNVLDYAKVLVSFSGGKDSIACVRAMLDLGVPRERMELWHQCVDGKGAGGSFMDWPCTESYVEKVGAALRIPVYFQWRHGGFPVQLYIEQSLQNAFPNFRVDNKRCFYEKVLVF